jgi:hypothetical protein
VIDYLRRETGLAAVAFVLFSNRDFAVYEGVLNEVV